MGNLYSVTMLIEAKTPMVTERYLTTRIYALLEQHPAVRLQTIVAERATQEELERDAHKKEVAEHQQRIIDSQKVHIASTPEFAVAMNRAKDVGMSIDTITPREWKRLDVSDRMQWITQEPGTGVKPKPRKENPDYAGERRAERRMEDAAGGFGD